MSRQIPSYCIYAIDLVDRSGKVVHTTRMSAEDATSMRKAAFKSLSIAAKTAKNTKDDVVLKYQDDAGRWWTLEPQNWNDALTFAEPDDESDEIGKLLVQVLAKGEEPASIGKSAGSAQKAHSQGDVADAVNKTLEEFNRLGHGLDRSGRQQFIRKLASNGLVIVGDFQRMELFSLLDTLSDLKIGKLDFEDLPSIVPNMISACLALPKETLLKLKLRVQKEASQIADGVRAERAKDTDDKTAGLFPTAAQQRQQRTKSEEKDVEEWVLPPIESQGQKAVADDEWVVVEATGL